MKSTAHPSFAERIGHSLGQVWRGGVRLDRQARAWLVAQGWAPGVVSAVMLVVKLIVLGVLVYVAFWLALLLAFALVGAWVIRNDDGRYDEEHKPEWRCGPAGYGLYSYDGHRIDLYDPADEQD